MKIRFVLVALLLAGLASNVQAKITTKTISYQHDDVNLEGFLAYDDSIKGKRPAVLVVHEWWGLDDYARSRVEQLAGMVRFLHAFFAEVDIGPAGEEILFVPDTFAVSEQHQFVHDRSYPLDLTDKHLCFCTARAGGRQGFLAGVWLLNGALIPDSEITCVKTSHRI